MLFTAAQPDRAFLLIGEKMFSLETGVSHEFDISAVSTELLYQLCYNALHTKVLIPADAEKLRSEWYSRQENKQEVATQLQQVVPTVKQEVPQTILDLAMRAHEAKTENFIPLFKDSQSEEFLQQGVAALRNQIKKLPEYDVRFLLDLETSRKNRKSVISLLNKRLAELELVSPDSRIAMSYEEEVIDLALPDTQEAK